MVTSITNFSRNGLCDWILQRVTALLLMIYVLFITGYLIAHPNINYVQWRTLFDCFFVKFSTLIAIFSLAIHAWIGIWTITTDYLNERALGNKGLFIRLPVQFFCFLLLLFYVVWTIQILWGIN